jgi:RNA polymerase-binding transcription factor DksA
MPRRTQQPTLITAMPTKKPSRTSKPKPLPSTKTTRKPAAAAARKRPASKAAHAGKTPAKTKAPAKVATKPQAPAKVATKPQAPAKAATKPQAPAKAATKPQAPAKVKTTARTQASKAPAKAAAKPQAPAEAKAKAPAEAQAKPLTKARTQAAKTAKAPVQPPPKAPKATKAAARPGGNKGKATGKASRPKASGTRKAGAAEAKPKASELIKRSHRTPAIFKTGRKATPIVFTIQDVRDYLKKRQRDEDHAAAIASAREAAGHGRRTRSGSDALTSLPERSGRHEAASLLDILGFDPVATSAPPIPAGCTVPRKWTKYYRMLTELRDKVREELNLHSSDTLMRSQKEDAGDISTSADAGTDNFDRDFALSLLSSEQQTLNEIEAAIQRIFKGSYGTCEVTGKPIANERLEAVPYTRFSLEGQRQHETMARRRVQRAGAFIGEGAEESLTFGDDDADS